MRTTGAFEIQSYRLTERDRETFAALGIALDDLKILEGDSVQERLLDIVKPMVLFAAHLPMYTRRTKHLEPIQAAHIRDALLRARDPYVLIFEELSLAIGVSLEERTNLNEFTSVLKDCLRSLQRAYPQLLDQIELQLREVFSVDGSSATVREQLKNRAQPLVGFAVEKSLSLFVREASKLDESRDWREAIARAVNEGRPPINWTDMDAIQFQARLMHIASDFHKLEELVAEHRLHGSSQILRIGLLDSRYEEARAIVSTPTGREQDVSELAQRLIQTLEDEELNFEGKRVRIAALAKVVEMYLRGKEE